MNISNARLRRTRSKIKITMKERFAPRSIARSVRASGVFGNRRLVDRVFWNSLLRTLRSAKYLGKNVENIFFNEVWLTEKPSRLVAG